MPSPSKGIQVGPRGSTSGTPSDRILAEGKVKTQLLVTKIVGAIVGFLSLAVVVAYFYSPPMAEKLFCAMGPIILAGFTGIIGLSAGRQSGS